MKRLFVAVSVAMTSMVVPLAAGAQEAGLTYAQVKAEYRQMSSVHIKKCDHNGDGIYGRTEMLCVSSIYQSFYLDRN